MGVDEFVSYLTGQAGEGFRAAAWYDLDGSILLYCREDIEVEEVKRRFSEIRGRLLTETPSESTLTKLGRLKVSIQLREDAILLHFPANDTQGILVGLEPYVARKLTSFVDQCRDRLGEDVSIERPGPD